MHGLALLFIFKGTKIWKDQNRKTKTLSRHRYFNDFCCPGVKRDRSFGENDLPQKFKTLPKSASRPMKRNTATPHAQNPVLGGSFFWKNCTLQNLLSRKTYRLLLYPPMAAKWFSKTTFVPKKVVTFGLPPYGGQRGFGHPPLPPVILTWTTFFFKFPRVQHTLKRVKMP